MNQELAKAKQTAYRFLSFRARSRHEMERKLREKGFSAETIRETLGTLDHLGYLNDREFAHNFVRQKLQRKEIGRAVLKSGLLEKGIEKGIIEEVLKEVFRETNEKEIASRALDRYRGSHDRRRASAFLLRRGFPYEVVEELLKREKA